MTRQVFIIVLALTLSLLINMNYFWNVNAQGNGTTSQINSSKIYLLNSNDSKIGEVITLPGTVVTEINISTGQTKVISGAVEQNTLVIPNGSIIITADVRGDPINQP